MNLIVKTKSSTRTPFPLLKIWIKWTRLETRKQTTTYICTCISLYNNFAKVLNINLHIHTRNCSMSGYIYSRNHTANVSARTYNNFTRTRWRRQGNGIARNCEIFVFFTVSLLEVHGVVFARPINSYGSSAYSWRRDRAPNRFPRKSDFLIGS